MSSSEDLWEEDRELGTEELETGMVNYNERQRQQRRAFKVKTASFE